MRVAELCTFATMKYGRYLNTNTNEFVNRAFKSEEQYNSIMSRGKKATGGWEPFPRQKVFISFFSPDKTYMGHVRNPLLKHSLLEPIVVENREHPSEGFQDVISAAINEADYFLAILTEQSRTSQWVNQEIGFAFATPKLNGRRFAFVEDKILHELKGFFHNQMQHPYTFKARSFPRYYAIRDKFIQYLEQQVIMHHDIRPVNS